MASPRVQPEDVENALDATRQFIALAATTHDARDAANWALAAKNMAGTVHSLAGARATQARGA